MSVVVPAAIWVFGFPSVGFALLPVLVGEFVSSGVVLIAAACGSFTAFAGLLARPVLARIPVRPDEICLPAARELESDEPSS